MPAGCPASEMLAMLPSSFRQSMIHWLWFRRCRCVACMPWFHAQCPSWLWKSTWTSSVFAMRSTVCTRATCSVVRTFKADTISFHRPSRSGFRSVELHRVQTPEPVWEVKSFAVWWSGKILDAARGRCWWPLLVAAARGCCWQPLFLDQSGRKPLSAATKNNK